MQKLFGVSVKRLTESRIISCQKNRTYAAIRPQIQVIHYANIGSACVVCSNFLKENFLNIPRELNSPKNFCNFKAKL